MVVGRKREIGLQMRRTTATHILQRRDKWRCRGATDIVNVNCRTGCIAVFDLIARDPFLYASKKIKSLDPKAGEIPKVHIYDESSRVKG